MTTQTWEPTQTNAKNWVSVTEAALTHLRKQLDKQTGAKHLRLGIKKSGCSGYKYAIEFIEHAESDDKAQPLTEDLTLFITPAAAAVVAGTEIDYTTEGLNSSIKFNNPNASNQCGCGESFSA